MVQYGLKSSFEQKKAVEKTRKSNEKCCCPLVGCARSELCVCVLCVLCVVLLVVFSQI